MAVMALTKEDSELMGGDMAPIVEEYRQIAMALEAKVDETGMKTPVCVEAIERFEFYERAKRCTAIIHTG